MDEQTRDLIVFAIIGILAGFLASFVVGGGGLIRYLVTGIIGILCCQILGIVAIITGKQATAEAAAAGFPPPSNAKTGVILGWIALALMAVGLVFWALLFALGAAGSFEPANY